MVKTELRSQPKSLCTLCLTVVPRNEESEDIYGSQALYENETKSQEGADALKTGLLCYPRSSFLGSHHTWLQKACCLLLWRSSPLD